MDACFEIRDAHLDDAEAIAEIYNHFVLHSIVTFDLEPKSVEKVRDELREGSLPWLVCVYEERVIAYSYASAWKSRCAYEHTVESTLYVSSEFGRRGIGWQLYTELLARLADAGVHTVLGGISVPNDPSSAMHKKLGFELIGTMREVGRKFDRWIDVEYWQKKLS